MTFPALLREENKYQGMMWGDKLNFCCDCVSDKKFLFHYVVQGSSTSHEQPEEPARSNIKHDIQFSISKAYEKHIHTQRTKMSFFYCSISLEYMKTIKVHMKWYSQSVLLLWSVILKQILMQNYNIKHLLELHPLIFHINTIKMLFTKCLQITVFHC